ncbi:MAG: NotI family restriction endonuclease [Syntrophaceticus sp.]
MPNIQLEAFGELFGGGNSKSRFSEKNYACPFDSRVDKCDKPNRSSIRYGSCSAQYGQNKRIICPRRFYEDNYKILKQVKNFIWNTDDTKIECYNEFRITSVSEDDSFYFGNLDWLLVNSENNNDFCGVEIQTDATTNTGEFKKAITDLLNNELKESYAFGLNTLASFKGFLPQFIFKGQLFDDWKRPYCAVMQDELWREFIKKFRIRYKEINTYTTETFMFFIYSLELADNKYTLGKPTIYATRWIDMLLSFSVKNELLIDLNDISEKIRTKMSRSSPIITL